MVDNRNVRIYVLKHPDTLEVRYVGKTVRRAIEELGGNMPETLPTPEKFIKELEKDELQKIGSNQ